MKLPPQAANAKLRAQIAGTRQMVHEAWQEELLRLLVDTNAVSAERAASMLDDLRARIWAHAEAPEYQLHPEEMELQSDRIEALAKHYRDLSKKKK
ncbi:MAG: hypothetical protein WCE79_14700 [Xanthobacteraceae bacterium]